MTEPVKTSPRPAPKKVFKYPSEDETFVRRIGSGVLACWSALPPEARERILAEAATAWDREYNIHQLTQKLDEFVRRHPARMV
ncbi:MAG TPA: hypothetical protein VII49_08810 [Rhizomicrobium sp.]